MRPIFLWWSTDNLVSFSLRLARLFENPRVHIPSALFLALTCPGEQPNRDAASQYQTCSRALLGLLTQDIGVTSVEDGHGGAAEELTAGGTKLNLFGGKKSPKVSSKLVPSRKNRSLLRWVGEAEQLNTVTDTIATGLSRSKIVQCIERRTQECTYVGASVVVDGSLGQHRVVLQLGLAERRGVAGNEDQLGLARAEG